MSLKNEMKKFINENINELKKKLNLKEGSWEVYEDGIGCYGKGDEEGIDISLNEIKGDEYNEIEKIKIGNKWVYYNNYR